MGKQWNVILLGLGNVGTGVIKSLSLNAGGQHEAFGGEIQISGILVQDIRKERIAEVDAGLLTDRYERLAELRGVDAVIEVIGGIEPAKSYIIDSLRRGRHVVTANKELMALHGRELLELAAHYGVHLLYEASVGGGIPVLGALSQFLRFNEIRRIAGILNGTTNYILTRMTEDGTDYESALLQAQQLGFAEADPTSDVEGFDAMFKLIILSRLAWGTDVHPDLVIRRGITGITAADIRKARESGCAWKLIAAAEKDADGIVRLSVQPELVAAGHPLRDVNNEFNAVTLSCNLAGELTFSGRGAGELPTASAVLGDLAYALSVPVKPSRQSVEALLVSE